MRVALAQLNPTVGDIAGNEAKIRDALGRAVQEGAQLALFPELGVATGLEMPEPALCDVVDVPYALVLPHSKW